MHYAGDSRVLLAAIIVPPSVLLLGVVWTIWWWRKYHAVRSRRDSTQGGLLHGRPGGLDIVANRPMVVSRQPYSEQPDIATVLTALPRRKTSLNRNNSRVLTRKQREGSESDESRRTAPTAQPAENAKPQKTHRSTGQFGAGEDEEGMYLVHSRPFPDSSTPGGRSRANSEFGGHVQYGHALSTDLTPGDISSIQLDATESVRTRRRTWNQQDDILDPLPATVPSSPSHLMDDHHAFPSRPPYPPHQYSSAGFSNETSHYYGSHESGVALLSHAASSKSMEKQYRSYHIVDMRAEEDSVSTSRRDSYTGGRHMNLVSRAEALRRSHSTPPLSLHASAEDLHKTPPPLPTIPFPLESVNSLHVDTTSATKSSERRKSAQSAYSSADLYTLERRRGSQSIPTSPTSPYAPSALTFRRSWGALSGSTNAEERLEDDMNMTTISVNTFGMGSERPARPWMTERENVRASGDTFGSPAPALRWLPRLDSSGTLPHREPGELILTNPDSASERSFLA